MTSFQPVYKKVTQSGIEYHADETGEFLEDFPPMKDWTGQITQGEIDRYLEYKQKSIEKLEKKPMFDHGSFISMIITAMIITIGLLMVAVSLAMDPRETCKVIDSGADPTTGEAHLDVEGCFDAYYPFRVYMAKSPPLGIKKNNTIYNYFGNETKVYLDSKGKYIADDPSLYVDKLSITIAIVGAIISLLGLIGTVTIVFITLETRKQEIREHYEDRTIIMEILTGYLSFKTEQIKHT